MAEGSVASHQNNDVRVENVYKSFREGRDKVLKGISHTFGAGKLTYILGSSGAGKSGAEG